MQQCHSVVPEGICDACTRLLVRAKCRQVVVNRKPLVASTGPNSAGDEHSFLGCRFPNSIQHRDKFRITGCSGQVRRPAHEVSRSNRVANNRLMVPNQGVVAPIFAVISVYRRVMFGCKPLGSSTVEKELCKFEVPLLTRCFGKLHQRKLGFRMPRVSHFLSRSKSGIDVVGKFPGNV